MREGQLTIVEPVDPEVAPVHEAVGEALDALERILETDVRRDDRFHRVDLVELFRRDRFFDHLLEEEAEEREDEADENPGAERPGNHGADEDGGREQCRSVRDHLIAHDHQSFRRLQFGADDEAEVKQHPAKYEIRERVHGEGGHQLDTQDGCAIGHVEPVQPGRIHAEGGDQRNDFATQVDPGHAQRFPLPQPIRDDRRARDRERGCGYAGERGLIQVRVLAERNEETPQRHRGAEQHEELGDLAQPAVIRGEHGDEQRRAHAGQRLTVERDEPRDLHACTAVASSRVRRSSAVIPPFASASIRALPTATPSADRAAAAACAGVPMPKPTATGKWADEGLAARTRRTWASRSGGTSSRAPVTPSREMRYTNPVALFRAVFSRPSSVVGATSRMRSSPRPETACSTAGSVPAGRSVRSTPAAPAAWASVANRSTPYASTGLRYVMIMTGTRSAA